MSEALLSVIVPVYRVEEYLNRCVESLVNQTYPALEIILVDDGSPDRCGAMCDEWAARDARIRAVHRENGGLACARNSGMAVCTGEYVTFVDSDDWLERDTYETVLQAMAAQSADAGLFNVSHDYGERFAPAAARCPLRTGDGWDGMKWSLLTRTGYRGYMCNKIYRRAALEEAGALPPVPVDAEPAEDLIWTVRALRRCGRVAFVDRPFYHYCHRSGSILGVPRWAARVEEITGIRREILELCRERADVYETAQAGYHFFLCAVIRTCYLAGEFSWAREYLARLRPDCRAAYERAAPPLERAHNRLLCRCVARGTPVSRFLPAFRLLNALDCLLFERGRRVC